MRKLIENLDSPRHELLAPDNYNCVGADNGKTATSCEARLESLMQA
jgi:hypothetical protein